MEMVPELVQHRLQLPPRIAAGLMDAMCGRAQLARRAKARLQRVKLDPNWFDHKCRDVAHNLTTAWGSKAQLVPGFSAVFFSAKSASIGKCAQVVIRHAQAGEFRVFGEHSHDRSCFVFSDWQAIAPGWDRVSSASDASSDCAST
jgi:hypothetical protein